MTEVIGWGEDEEHRHPSRIHWRPPRWVIVVVAAAALVAVVVVPPLRARLARDAAGWLATSWGERSRYDDARDAVVMTAGSRIAVGDDRLAAQITAAMDSAEAAALNRLADAVRGHRTWAADVQVAADDAVRALTSEVAALRAEATSGHPIVAAFYAGEKANALIAAADAAVSAAVRSHHATPAPPSPVRLPSPVGLLQRLARPTDAPTGLGLVLQQGGHRVVLDLDTGRSIVLSGLTGEVRSLGHHVVGTGRHGAWVFDAREGSRRQLATDGGVRLAGVDDSTVWIERQQRLREFTAAGKALGGWHVLPANVHYVAMAQGPATITFGHAGLFRVLPRLWYPATGRQLTLTPHCLGGTTSGGGLFLLLGCGESTRGTVIDAVNGTERTVPMPRHALIGGMAQAISPDGQHVAVLLREGYGGAAAVDLSNGQVLRAPGPSDLFPAAWSPDGRWLLLADWQFGSSHDPARVVLWRVGSRRLESVRLPDRVGDQPTYVDLVRLR